MKSKLVDVSLSYSPWSYDCNQETKLFDYSFEINLLKQILWISLHHWCKVSWISLNSILYLNTEQIDQTNFSLTISFYLFICIRIKIIFKFAITSSLVYSNNVKSNCKDYQSHWRKILSKIRWNFIDVIFVEYWLKISDFQTMFQAKSISIRKSIKFWIDSFIKNKSWEISFFHQNVIRCL